MKSTALCTQLHSPIHPSWDAFFDETIIDLLNTIYNEISNTNYTPDTNRILHFSTLDLSKIKVIILGQDPYPQKGIATGRAFEVAGLNSWNQTFRNVSLKNIVRSVYFAHTNQYLNYKQIIAKIESNLFAESLRIAAPNQLFKIWEEQGVLLLNTSFSCEIGHPGSHETIWAPFTNLLFRFINQSNPDIIWFLWGKHAQNATTQLTLKNQFKSNHPMICKPGSEDFLFGDTNMFAATKNIVDWTGMKPIIAI